MCFLMHLFFCAQDAVSNLQALTHVPSIAPVRKAATEIEQLTLLTPQHAKLSVTVDATANPLRLDHMGRRRLLVTPRWRRRRFVAVRRWQRR